MYGNPVLDLLSRIATPRKTPSSERSSKRPQVGVIRNVKQRTHDQRCRKKICNIGKLKYCSPLGLEMSVKCVNNIMTNSACIHRLGTYIMLVCGRCLYAADLCNLVYEKSCKQLGDCDAVAPYTLKSRSNGPMSGSCGSVAHYGVEHFGSSRTLAVCPPCRCTYSTRACGTCIYFNLTLRMA